jgi:hypothetical protein
MLLLARDRCPTKKVRFPAGQIRADRLMWYKYWLQNELSWKGGQR